MFKKDLGERVVELQTRIEERRTEQRDREATIDQQRDQLATTLASDSEDHDWIDDLRRGIEEDEVRLSELPREIAVLEQQLAEAEEDVARAERKSHLRRAWDLEQEIQLDAQELHDAQVGLERAYVRLEAKLEQQRAELAAAGTGHGTSTSLLNRLRTVLASTLWAAAPKFCEAAKLPRVANAHRRTLDEFLDKSRPARPNAA